MTNPRQLRQRAEETTVHLAPLMARAEKLANTVVQGGHGRRKPGHGDDFWQYRPMQAGDSLRMVDWRRSARSDAQFIRQKEWQISQTVLLWANRAQSMRYASQQSIPEKLDRAQLLALALAILLHRGGERVGLLGEAVPPSNGLWQMRRLGEALLRPSSDDFAAPQMSGLGARSTVVLISDFLAEMEDVTEAVEQAVMQGVRGTLLQILDPAEISFPFRGRRIFESVGGSQTYETLQASDLSERYKARLLERQVQLKDLAQRSGWNFHTHVTHDPAQAALRVLYQMIEARA